MVNKFIGLCTFLKLDTQHRDTPIILVRIDEDLIMPVVCSPKSAQWVSKYREGEELLIDGHLSQQLLNDQRRVVIISSSVKRNPPKDQTQVGGSSEWRR